jgi:two-component system chemotaxis response regulator CheB
MTKVLVAEDSATIRELLIEILRSGAGMEVVGEAKNGMEAVEMTKDLRPDVITMDIRMPVMDGFEATKQIMVEAPTPIVIVSASVDVKEVEISMQALRVGALSVLPKPAGPGASDFEEARRRFVDTIKAMSQVKVVRRWPETPSRATPSIESRVALRRPARIVAMAASTGGPAALCQILAELPGDFPVPIVVVQHIAEGFVAGFASWLNTSVSIRVKVAEQGEPLLPHTVYVAPDNRHLGMRSGGAVLISSDAPVDGFRPSASFLFNSTARVFGSSALAVVLTGMGWDGLEGVRAIRSAGGQIVVQDKESSVVFGMPGVVAAAGLSDSMVPLSAIAARLTRSVTHEKGDR